MTHPGSARVFVQVLAILQCTLPPRLLPLPADIPQDIVESHKTQHMTALQVQQAELPPRAPPSRKLTREVSSAISESAAKRAEALAAMEAQVAETKLSLEVGDIMPATAAAQQGRPSCLQTALLHGLLDSGSACPKCSTRAARSPALQPFWSILQVSCSVPPSVRCTA